MPTCPSCGWPTGHDRDCKLLRAGGDVRHYQADVEQLPELCTVNVDRAADGTVTFGAFRNLSGDGADCVALSLPLFRDLVARSSGKPVEGGMETRLRALEVEVARAAEVSALATAAIERFVQAVEQERAHGLCLECDGLGHKQDNDELKCAPCNGTGRAQ